MFCPSCREVEMHEVSKQGVLIDVCPRCRGVWLDRGELEKVLAAGRSEPPDYDSLYGEKRYEKRPETGHDYGHDHYKHKKPHKKKRFFDMFEEIFD